MSVALKFFASQLRKISMRSRKRVLIGADWGGAGVNACSSSRTGLGRLGIVRWVGSGSGSLGAGSGSLVTIMPAGIFAVGGSGGAA